MDSIARGDLRTPIKLMPDLESRLKNRAHELGFSLVGIAPAEPADGLDRYLDWLEHGFHGEMAYLQKHAEAKRHPNALLQSVRSVVMVGLDDWVSRDESAPALRLDEPASRPTTGKIARFARGPDYHQEIWRRLDQLQEWLQREVPGCKTRGVCDTAPLLERDFARRAGLGWIAKNTMLINKHRGSYILLGGMLTDAELKPDPPHEGFHCGTCTACLEACPTHAFPAPGVLDARKCISYLNIEVKGTIPESSRNGLGDWLYGCDICQEVCPWNRHAIGGAEAIDAIKVLGMSDEEFRRRYRGTTIFRIHRRGLARNAATVLGNTAGPEALTALRAACADPEPIVREAAEWAIQQIESRYLTSQKET